MRAFDGDFGLLTEMDALVAYLQILGELTDLPPGGPTNRGVLR